MAKSITRAVQGFLLKKAGASRDVVHRYRVTIMVRSRAGTRDRGRIITRALRSERRHLKEQLHVPLKHVTSRDPELEFAFDL